MTRAQALKMFTIWPRMPRLKKNCAARSRLANSADLTILCRHHDDSRAGDLENALCDDSYQR